MRKTLFTRVVSVNVQGRWYATSRAYHANFRVSHNITAAVRLSCRGNFRASLVRPIFQSYCLCVLLRILPPPKNSSFGPLDFSYISLMWLLSPPRSLHRFCLSCRTPPTCCAVPRIARRRRTAPLTGAELLSRVDSWCVSITAARGKYGDINDWDVSQITDFSRLFSNPNCRGFDSTLDKWNTSSGTTFASMFEGAAKFSQHLNKWETSRATYMEGMFYDATSFNGDIAAWDTARVQSMQYMFAKATSFDRDISSWDTRRAKTLDHMFLGAASFSHDLSKWQFSFPPPTAKDMFTAASSSACVWDNAGVYPHEDERTSVGRIYCDDGKAKDGAVCSTDEECDTNVCGSERCCGYAVQDGCSTCTKSGGCFFLPTVTEAWRETFEPSIDVFPNAMTVGDYLIVRPTHTHTHTCVQLCTQHLVAVCFFCGTLGTAALTPMYFLNHAHAHAHVSDRMEFQEQGRSVDIVQVRRHPVEYKG